LIRALDKLSASKFFLFFIFRKKKLMDKLKSKGMIIVKVKKE